MPQDLTEAEEFSEPITVPESGDDRTAASIVPAFQALANRTRHLFNLITGFVDAVHTWTNGQGFAGTVGFYAAVVLGGAANELVYADELGMDAPRLRTVMIEPTEMLSENTGWYPRTLTYGGVQTEAPLGGNGTGRLALRIPHGGTLVRVRLGYERKAAGADARLVVYRLRYEKTIPFREYPADQIVAVQIDTVGQRLVDTGPISDLPLDTSTSSYMLEISAGQGRTQPLPDIVYWIEIQYLDPGPRNY